MADNSDLFPRFFKVFLSETASESLVIPLSFNEFLADPLPKTVKLQGIGGKIWTVSLEQISGAVYFTTGWSKFAKDHELKNGEFMTFVYDGHRTFEVSVFERFGFKETRAEIQAIQLSDSHSDSVVEDEEDSSDVDVDDDDDDDDSCGEDEEISQSLYPIDDEETKTDAAVFEGNLDIQALTNPHFPTRLKNRIYELLIPANVVNDNKLKFGDSVKYIDGEGTLVGLKGKWADKRICFKGWDRICRRNRLKKHQDTVECELLHDDQRMVHSIRVHVLRRTD
ncbi:DNA-binding pseudobarrel domain superfamily [Arabidopsis thaliana x Arabidopsis arenosa]|uniref:DNA-binding pseudobarrel domain superfamily n=1 Tax=Arabidopsis thaliana x Arabidopsis arenosa TaxID=1240361 RepID=A0A8T1ZRC1_9BRAS|nr:DNA-binding pseudobarrel domain superfamily [Arabidopsis thaliana x Arabidopsis arenosa]